MADDTDIQPKHPDEPVTAPDDASSAEEGPPSRRRRIVVWAAIGLGVLLAAGILLPGYSVTQAGYYGRYPSLAKRMDMWSTSTHAQMTCVQCHVEPGVGAFVGFAVKAIPAFYSQVLQGPSATNVLASPSKKACNKCHTTYRQVGPSGDLLIPHRAHVVVLGLECNECHKDLVHSLNRRGFNRPEMEGCLEKCHDGVKAKNECSACHSAKSIPNSHKASTWLKVHGETAKAQDCGECHDWTPKYCEECHSKRPASHSGNWKKRHAAPAKERSSGCLVCHEDAFCKECH